MSEAEFVAMVQAAADLDDFFRGTPPRLLKPKLMPPWAVELRQMLNALAESEFDSGKASPLTRLCHAGANYGMRKLGTTLSSDLLTFISPKARAHLRRDLERTIARATKPCFALESETFQRAFEAVWLQPELPSAEAIEQKFLGRRPSDRLFSMFRRFPVLARLWSLLITQWCDQIAEFLSRFQADQRALSRTFFNGRPVGQIIDLRAGLSDPHNKGRTVIQLRVGPGSLIYKPRSGDGEWEWNELLRRMNVQSFRPKLRVAGVLPRKGYCWMERIEPAPCQDRAAARRFYERLGGLIAAAYLVRAVDCHRDNLIAAGEHPVLIDAETLWHVSRDRKAQTPREVLNRTGFLPISNKRSRWQYRSSALGKTSLGPHTPHIAGRSLSVAGHEREIVRGFIRAWHSILGTRNRRVVFERRMKSVRSSARRWIYRATEKYNAIGRASVHPANLKSGIERDSLVARLSRRTGIAEAVIQVEINALKRLDVPYFRRKTGELLSVDEDSPSEELLGALRHALQLCA